MERPQSKQESRNKIFNNSASLLKSILPETGRPQTSKGQRPKVYREL